MQRIIGIIMALLHVFCAAALELTVDRYVTVNEGLPRNGVRALMQSRCGLVYIGTWDGLYSYDGSRVNEIISMVRGDNRIVECLTEGPDGRVWAGTSRGVAVYDPSTLRADDVAIDAGVVVSIICDRYGTVHCLTNKGRHFGIYDGGVREQRNDACAIYKRPDGTVGTIMTDGATDDGRGGLPRRPVAACCDSTGRLIVATVDNEIWSAAPAGRFERICAVGVDSRVRTMARYGEATLMTTSSGLYSLADGSETAERVSGLNDETVMTAMSDREGGLWVGTYYGGVNYIAPLGGDFNDMADVNDRLDGHVVSAITRDEAGNYWFGIEDGGLSRYNPSDGSVENFNSRRPQGVYVPGSDNVQGVYASSGNVLLVGPLFCGLEMLELPSMKRRPVKGKNPLSVFAFFEREPGKVWVGAGDGLYTLDVGSATLKREDAVGQDVVHSIVGSADGSLWVAAYGLGVYRRKPDGKWVRYVLPQGKAISLCASGSRLYIGTEGSDDAPMYVADIPSGKITALPLSLPEHMIVFDIHDVDGRIWFTTNRGLLAYNPDSKRIAHYTVRDGLQSNQFKVNSGLALGDTLIFGGVNGLNAFRPAGLRRNDGIVPRVSITDMYVFGRAIEPGASDCRLDSAVSVVSRVSLPPEADSFSWRFASSSYRDPSKNRYDYMLEPLESTWHSITEPERTAAYTNLPAGRYVLRVRTSNGGEQISEERRLEVIIRPYWWASPVMKCVYALLVMIIFVWLGFKLHRRRRQMLRRRFAAEPQTSPELICSVSRVDREFLERLHGATVAAMSDPALTVDVLAQTLGMGRSQFFSKVKELTGQTPNEYIRTLRLREAANIIRKGDARINEVCYAVGFSSPSYFARRFAEQFGLSPSAYAKECLANGGACGQTDS